VHKIIKALDLSLQMQGEGFWPDTPSLLCEC
jgi:hypothetical protein